jgi:hypothetical protein
LQLRSGAGKVKEYGTCRHNEFYQSISHIQLRRQRVQIADSHVIIHQSTRKFNCIVLFRAKTIAFVNKRAGETANRLKEQAILTKPARTGCLDAVFANAVDQMLFAW